MMKLYARISAKNCLLFTANPARTNYAKEAAVEFD